MDKERLLWRFIAAHLKRKQPVMLLVVAESSGSSPGRQGFKMAVGADGALCGSIGGGIMEVKLVELAKTRLKESPSDVLVKKQIHRKAAPRHQSGMICSGEQTVLFWALDPQHHLKAVSRVLYCLKNHKSATLKLAQTAEGRQFEVAEKEVPAMDFQFESPGAPYFFYAEKLGFKNRLYIVGGGHCALALSALMSNMDFYLCLLDDRPDLSTLRKNKFIHEKRILDTYDQVGGFIPSGPDVYVVVMTLGYRSDALVLRQLLDKNLRYLGLLGSAAKVSTLLEALRSERYPLEKIEQIKAPIGLPIHSRTPEEIAVSIAAELILRKNGEG